MVEAGGTQDGDSLLATSRGGVVSARGTSDGVTLRLDGRVTDESLKVALCEFMNPRKSFLGGQEVALEWVGVRPQSQLVDDLTKLLLEEYGVAVRSSKVRESQSASIPAPSVTPLPQKEQRESQIVKEKVAISDEPDFSSLDEDPTEQIGLFSGIGDINNASSSSKERATTRPASGASLADPSLWDDPDARIIYSTLRSGQRIDSEHAVIVVGDVNPGAEIVAGGDVIVLGSLRGVAHAGAYDETGGGRTIFALSLQPTQLRIGTTISRGSPEGGKVPEIARIEGNMIVVEQFMKKAASKRW